MGTLPWLAARPLAPCARKNHLQSTISGRSGLASAKDPVDSGEGSSTNLRTSWQACMAAPRSRRRPSPQPAIDVRRTAAASRDRRYRRSPRQALGAAVPAALTRLQLAGNGAIGPGLGLTRARWRSIRSRAHLSRQFATMISGKTLIRWGYTPAPWFAAAIAAAEEARRAGADERALRAIVDRFAEPAPAAIALREAGNRAYHLCVRVD